MRPTLLMFSILLIGFLAACSGNDNSEDNTMEEELAILEVDFELPETADVGETIELKATVTYGDELVTDAEYVDFEYWEEGHEDDSVTIESTNHEDGTYTAEVAFDHDGVFMIYAHTQARTMHTMPKKSVVVGEGASESEEGHDAEHEHENVDGFHLHFVEPEEASAEDETELMVHLQMDDEPLEQANVRFEIWTDASENHEWVDAEETTAGEYVAQHTFPNSDTYYIQIHVENDEGLHEHEEHEITVSE